MIDMAYVEQPVVQDLGGVVVMPNGQEISVIEGDDIMKTEFGQFFNQGPNALIINNLIYSIRTGAVDIRRVNISIGQGNALGVLFNSDGTYSVTKWSQGNTLNEEGQGDKIYALDALVSFINDNMQVQVGQGVINYSNFGENSANMVDILVQSSQGRYMQFRGGQAPTQVTENLSISREMVVPFRGLVFEGEAIINTPFGEYFEAGVPNSFNLRAFLEGIRDLPNAKIEINISLNGTDMRITNTGGLFTVESNGAVELISLQDILSLLDASRDGFVNLVTGGFRLDASLLDRDEISRFTLRSFTASGAAVYQSVIVQSFQSIPGGSGNIFIQ